MRDTAKSELTKGGLQWVLGTGYVNMYSLVHRAEEALIESECDNTAIVEGALNDELRIQGSDIRNSDDLLTKLRRAVRVLNPEAAGFLNKQPPIDAEPDSDSQKAEADAKATLRVVRSAIDGYRDDQRDGLVRARNHLLWVATIFWLITFALLGLAIIWKVPGEALLTATAFFLVGAIVGLFSRLHSQSAAHSDVDDFGLFVAGLIASPALSGSAAVFGVFLTAALISVGLLGGFWSPSATPTAAATVIPTSTAAASSMTLPSSPVATNVPATPVTTSTPGAPTPQNENKSAADFSEVLSETYDLRRNPAGLIYAAIFGLAPNLLIGTLQQQTTRYQEQLKSSGPADRGGTAS